MIIVCPEAYSSQQSAFTTKFDATITYEMIGAFFGEMTAEAGDDLVMRYQLRRELFDQAIHKHRRGYTAIPDKVVTHSVWWDTTSSRPVARCAAGYCYL